MDQHNSHTPIPDIGSPPNSYTSTSPTPSIPARKGWEIVRLLIRLSLKTWGGGEDVNLVKFNEFVRNTCFIRKKISKFNLNKGIFKGRSLRGLLNRVRLKLIPLLPKGDIRYEASNYQMLNRQLRSTTMIFQASDFLYKIL